ncbi:BQ5605_C010g06004 [Microbotryum silenes-dioicae]|uniref:BQ5605_C010g06004 protein n=1 Tax=Microbotryum silenes-dioicae TaxID=796604 RepID=A0A2X0MJH7_9BASI|nr:BQ5605_C010g06004 [Microbotryum silenes-dioicae]
MPGWLSDCEAKRVMIVLPALHSLRICTSFDEMTALHT